ncbi:uncharacterized protein LOC133202501 [Saccostrea echinata]|uniref:uncharacterized protein LOC133202501 n=1 Tax=Saccostrea echinata TaxID=191078 RepID=UPI002A818D08|nr:uncharacterized protein LOC133202501 [Saccostrea echinata]
MADCSSKVLPVAISSFFYTNSMLAPMCILSMSIVIMIIFSTSKSIPKPHQVVWGTEAIMTFISMLFTFLVWFLVHSNRGAYLTGQVKDDVSRKVKLVFLWIFGLGNILNSGFYMATNIGCLINGGPKPYEGEQFARILCRVIEIFFCIGQLGFLSLYGKYRFKSSSLINYGISFMVIAHLLRWCRSFFDSVMEESRMSSMSNKTTIYDCFYNSVIYISIRKISAPYIGPIIDEYCLLSVAIAIKMFITFDVGSSIQIEEEATRQGHSRTGSMIDQLSAVSRNMFEKPRHRQSFIVSIGCGITLSIPFLVAYFLPLFNRKLSWIDNITRIPYDLLNLFLLCFGYRQFNLQFHEKLDRHSEKIIYQPVLIFVTAGAIAYTTFGCIPGVMFLHQTAGRALLVDKSIQAINIIFQSMLILHVQTFCFKDAKVHVHVACIKVHNTFLCLFVMNIIHWTSITFRKPNSTMSLEIAFYGEDYWRVIMHMTYPIILFYRFLTAIEMYELYRKTIIYRQC